MNKACYLRQRIDLTIDHLVMNSTTKAHSSFSPLPLDVIIYSHKEAHKSPGVSGVDVSMSIQLCVSCRWHFIRAIEKDIKRSDLVIRRDFKLDCDNSNAIIQNSLYMDDSCEKVSQYNACVSQRLDALITAIICNSKHHTQIRFIYFLNTVLRLSAVIFLLPLHARTSSARIIE